MSLKSGRNRRHIHLDDEDWELLQALYGPQSPGKIGASEAIRTLVHKACKRLRQKSLDAVDREVEESGEDETGGGKVEMDI